MNPLTRLEQLREIALDQHGYVTTAQALEEGLAHANLSTMVARGRLQRVAHGVYRVPQVAETPADHYQLAVLWAGAPEACLSHETAMEVRGLGDVNPSKIHLTVTGRRRIRRAGGELYEIHYETLKPQEVDWWNGVRCVTVPTAIRQCIVGGTPSYLIDQALHQARGTSALKEDEYYRLKRMLSDRDR